MPVRPRDHAMRLRTPLLLSASVIAGLFWSLDSNVQAAIMHFIAPPLVSIVVAALWGQSSARWQFLILLVSLGAAELLRVVMYCVRANGWRYVSGDSETQLAFATSFGLQLVIGGAVWAVVQLFFRRHETRTA
jgi:hypothetical protein